ncbi:MAG: hypothetical protein HFI33_14130 [Lachnospiraceae bacterium]|nr:hypothetical protein [Lachnospiraceae bacterium]
MKTKKQVGFVCFGEVNTPYERLQTKHDQALSTLETLDMDYLDGGIVIDDTEYQTADMAIEKLKAREMCCLIVCVVGWIPSHAVIRVTDCFRNTPMILWGLCGWTEGTRIVTTADQAATTALRPAFEAMGYAFKYVYNVMGEPEPVEKLQAFVNAAYTAKELRRVRIGTMGYRDMLLYGTQYEGNSLRADLGVEVEPFEMLEMVQNTEKLSKEKVAEWTRYVQDNWVFEKPCDSQIVETGVKYALAIGKKIEERGYQAISLIDVDGMKKLLGFPPAMVFMLLNHFYGVQVVPENDVMGAVTQSMLSLITGDTVPYLEYYEFFKTSMLIGVPDFIPEAATDGDIRVLPTAFGLLSASLLNVSKVKTGYVTCARLVYKKGAYAMHMYTGEAKTPPSWEECGWEPPAPQLPSLEVFPDSCTVEEFSQKVSSQHVIVAYGDYRETLTDLCKLLHIEIL